MDDVRRRFPADHHVMVDDKPQLLEAMKDQLGDNLTTVFVRQGHYADEAKVTAGSGIDISIDSIAEMVNLDRGRFLPGTSSRRLNCATISMEAT